MLHYWGEKAPSVFCPRLLIRENRTNDQQSQREKANSHRRNNTPSISIDLQLRYTSFSLQETTRNPPPTAQGALPFSPHGIPGASSSQLRGRPGIRREGWRCWAPGGAAFVHHRVSPHPLEWVVDSTRGPKELHHTGT